MRLIFMGSPEYSVPSLRAIHKDGHDVVAVVSQPARRSGRGKHVHPTPVAVAAEELGIETLTPERADDEEFVSTIRDLSPDIIVVVAYGQILRRSLLSIPKHGCVNAHASLLPRWRGASPLSAAIMAGDEHSGVTLIEMVKKLDAGPILITAPMSISPRETSGTLHDKLKELSASLLVGYLDFLGNVPKGATHPGGSQDESEMTYAPRLEKGAGQIDWSQSREEIDRHVRAMTPWPGAYSHLDCGTGKRLKVLAAEGAGGGFPWLFTVGARKVPGTVVAADADNGILVATGDGCLRLLRVQLAGRNVMEGIAFVQGRGIAIGDRLGFY